MSEKISSIQPKYKLLPIITLNTLIRESKGQVSDNQVSELMKSGKISSLSLDKTTLEKLSHEYIKDYMDLSRIPILIKLESPLKSAFDEICFYDTPGVNALGDLQEVTHENIRNVDAIVFVHSIQANIEDQHLMDFIRKQRLNEDVSDTVFLVLTKSSKESIDEREKRLKDAQLIFQKVLPPDKIICVDSIDKIIYDELSSFNSIEHAKSEYIKLREDLRKKVSSGDIDYSGSLSLINYKITAFNNLLNQEDEINPISLDTILDAQSLAIKRSNFHLLENLLSQFAVISPIIRVRDFIKSIEDEYLAEMNDINFKKSLLKIENAEDLKKTINAENEKLKKVNTEIDFFMNKLKKNHFNDDEWTERLDELWDDLKDSLISCDDVTDYRKALKTYRKGLKKFTEDLLFDYKSTTNDFLTKLNLKIVLPDPNIVIPKTTIETDKIEKIKSKAQKQVTTKEFSLDIFKWDEPFFVNRRDLDFGHSGLPS